MQEEIWKAVVGYEGRYEVSNLGRIKSLDRQIVGKTRTGSTYVRIKKGCILSGMTTSFGYINIELKPKIKDKTVSSVHSIVAEAFLGRRPSGFDIDHLNNIRNDNRASNLEYVTRQENLRRGRSCALNPNKLSRFIGVTWNKSKMKWQASIDIPKRLGVKFKTVNLGYFDDESEAGSVYESMTPEKAILLKQSRRDKMGIFKSSANSWFFVVCHKGQYYRSSVFGSIDEAKTARDLKRLEFGCA
jgi:hypothetical protein